MTLCPDCGSFLEVNNSSPGQEVRCAVECGFKAVVWLEDGEKYGQCIRLKPTHKE